MAAPSFRSNRFQIKAAAFLAGALVILIATVFCQNHFRQQNNEFEHETRRVQLMVEDEIRFYQLTLQGVRGAIVVNGFRPEAARFRDYTAARQDFATLRGSLGFGFIRAVDEPGLKAYERAQVRARPGFSIHPRIRAPLHMVIELIEPLERNMPALGLDVAFEAHRRQAALRAMTQGTDVLSRKIELVQNNEKHTGFLYFLPIYSTAVTPATEAERSRLILGWAYAPIVLERIFESLRPKIPEYLRVEVDTGDGEFVSMHPAPGNDAAGHRVGGRGRTGGVSTHYSLVSVGMVSVGGQTWKLRVSGAPKALANRLLAVLFAAAFGVLLIGFGANAVLRSIDSKDRSLGDKTQWLNAVIESAGYAVIATTPEGTIQIFNPAAERLLGYEARTLIGKKDPPQFRDPEEIPARMREMSEALGMEPGPGLSALERKLDMGLTDRGEWRYVREDGSKVEVGVCTSAIRRPSGELLGYLSIAEDLTEKRRLAGEIESQRAQMIESEKLSLLGEMAGGIAHEINTPLTIILGKAAQLGRKLDQQGLLTVENAAYVSKIENTARRIAKIVRSLRLYSRQSENDPMDRVELAAVIDVAVDIFGEKLRSGELELRIEGCEGLAVMGRLSELSQVILNLLGNSLDACSGHERPWIEIRAERAGGLVTVFVTDSGTGIAPEIASKIMNPFFTTKDVGKGTGLGLSLSRGIAESHGGRLFYDPSCPNTRFCLELPAAAAAGRNGSAA